MATSTTIGPGTMVGDYQIVEELGAGGAAIVYRAIDTKQDRLCALKLLHSSAVADETMQHRFLREIAVMRRVEHENLVRIYEGGLHLDRFYYAMELVDTGTLKDVLRGPLPWRDAAETALQLADGLAVLHQSGVLHRDLKPANIYLSSSGHAKIGDLGLARDAYSDRLTQEGMTVGTVLYMAPEQIYGADELSGSVDLYALGCVLYEMLTGRTPFVGAQAMAICEQHIESPPPDPRETAPDCPDELARLVKVLLAKKPEDRPRDADAVAQALRQILGGEPVELLGRTHAEIHDAAPTPTAASPPESPAETKNLTERLVAARHGRRSGPTWRTWTAIAAMAAALIAAAIALQSW